MIRFNFCPDARRDAIRRVEACRCADDLTALRAELRDEGFGFDIAIYDAMRIKAETWRPGA